MFVGVLVLPLNGREYEIEKNFSGFYKVLPDSRKFQTEERIAKISNKKAK